MSTNPTADAPAASETTARFSITVDAPIERAFTVFTAEMGSWWAPEHHLNDAPFAAIIVEPRVGGRWYELGIDGSQCEWGMVLAWDPPEHFALSWHLDGDFRYDPEAGRSSRVDVWFRAGAVGSTTVQLEHSGLDQHGDSWRRLRDAIASDDGWPLALRRFGDVAGQSGAKSS